LEDRLGFVRKVYGILTAQLLITAFMCCIPAFHEPTRLWLKDNVWLLIVSFVVWIVTLCCVFCSKKMARTVPWNYLILLVFTVSMGEIVMYCTSLYEPKSVLAAAGMTLMVVLGLTVYVYNTKDEINYSSAGCSIVAFALSTMCLFMAFSDVNRSHAFYSCMFCIMFGFYIVYDTHQIMGGGHHEIDSEDYIIASMIIYLDIINLFLHVLKLMGEKRN